MHHEWKKRRNFLLLESFKRWIIYPKYYLTDPNFQTRTQSKMRFSRRFIRYRAKSVVDIYASLNESWQTLPLNVVTFLPLCQNMLPQPFIIQTRWGLHIFTTFFQWKFSLVLFAQVVQKSLEENQKPENSLRISNAKLKSTGTASTNGYMLDQQENTVHSNWIRAASLIKNVSLTVSNDWPQKQIFQIIATRLQSDLQE